MSRQSVREVVRCLSGLAVRRPETDGELLRAYAASRDEGAFAELVCRHSALVWSVCSRSLPCVEDAEDAFQATFFVLARQAASVRKGDALASWLFGVARRTASVMRQRHQRPDPRPPLAAVPDPCGEITSAETCEAILEEVRRLPEKYRLPLLLCGVEGLTKAEAARRLGWKEGTVSGRLARARTLLGRRLGRRGLATAAGSLTALEAVLPRSLPAATAAGALQFVVGEAARRSAATLAQEVLRSMHTASLKVYTGLLTACLLAVVGGVLYAQRPAVGGPGVAAPPPAPKKVEALPPAWKERLILRGYAGAAYGEFSPDGRTFATSDARNVLRFLDTATWKERSRCLLTRDPRATYFPQWHPFSPDGQLFVLGWRIPTEGGKAKHHFETWLIEVRTGKVRTVLEGKEPRFSPVGNLLAIQRDDAVILYDHASGKEVRSLPTGGPIAWRGDRFSPDGRRLFLPSSDGRGKLWDVRTGEAVAQLQGFGPVWSRDGVSLATVLPGPIVMLWDAATGKERATLRGFSEPGCNVQFSPDGRLVLTSVFEDGLRADGEIDFPEGGRPYKPKRVPLDVRLWDARTGKELVRLPGERLHCRGGAFAPDGKTVVYVRLNDGPGYKTEAVLWDVAAGKERLVLRDDEGVDDVTCTPVGAMIVGSVGRDDRARLQVWDDQGRVLSRMDGGNGTHRFSPDGRFMVRSVSLPVPGPLTKPVPTPMEIRILQWSAGPVTRETRGEPVELKPERPEEPRPLSEAARAFATVKKESEASEGEFAKQYAAARTEAEREALGRARLAALEGLAARALELARKHPKDDAAVDALEYALRCTGGMEGKLGAMGGEVVAQVRQTLLTSPSLGKLLPWLGFHQSEEARVLLREALDRSPDRTVRGRACYWLANALAEDADAARLLRQWPELARRPEARDRQEHFKRLSASDPEATARRAEELFARLGKEFADVKHNDFQPTTLGELAERALFALRHLAVGKTAPPIEGQDLDGKPMKLSDYRGRVVVLVFCGHWCGPCRAMNPHKQELVKRHAGQPFALLEVNSDAEPDEWKRVMKKEGLTWRCWADGGTEGPIATKWNVGHWPTVYVLDARGVIRYKELRDEALSKAVATLLAEVARK